ncbi:adenosylhomocysteinase [Olegusella massiliensis]|uniref:adenosylhomocysteinase n=1 Tax=Olegusella massiliensis TaxID=1776381 RepID=UPI000839090B|nr:adenosylhomocysteinase [Olegusella massiliensis]
MEFAQWVAELSVRTNRSLAGSRVFVTGDALTDDLRAAFQSWGLLPIFQREQADFIWNELPQKKELTGAEAMARAAKYMPVTRALIDRLVAKQSLEGLRIAVCLVLEPKTSVLLQELKRAGAEVGVCAPAAEVDQRVADELARRDVIVEACATWTPEQDHAAALRLLDRLRPNLIVDDGGSFARLCKLERPALSRQLIGVAEETTSGVRAFAAMEAARELSWPVVAVNDSRLKTCFDNRHGTGETCVTSMQALLGWNCFSRAEVVVIGYGPVGEGFARRICTLGADVCIVDGDPAAALRARFDGFNVADIAEAFAGADMVVSATGVRHTVSMEEMKLLRDKTILAVIGGIAHELALDDLPADALGDADTNAICELQVPDGPTLRLLAHGDGVNYTAGGGNPIEVMDLSLAVQVAAIAYLAKHKGELPAKLLRLGKDDENLIAQLALAVRGASARQVGQKSDTVPDWKLTRFSDA